MNAEPPRKIFLTGSIELSEINNLSEYCSRLHHQGHRHIDLDMAGVTDCGRAGLYGLLALTQRQPNRTEAYVQGAHWAHFRVLLRDAPIGEVEVLCDRVRELMRRTARPL